MTFEAGGRTAIATHDDLSNAIGNGGVLLLDFNSSTVEFLGNFLDTGNDPVTGLPYEFTHVSALVQPDAAGGPSTLIPFSLSESIQGFTVQGEYQSWFRGAVPYDPQRSYYVVDLTNGTRAPDGAVHLGLAAWTPDTTTQYPLRSATVFLHPDNASQRFTLHYKNLGQPEMVQSYVAWPLGGGNAAGFVGSIASGSTFWITRDADGWGPEPSSVPHFQTGDIEVHWEGYWVPLPENLQLVDFYLRAGVTDCYVHQNTA
ncbi:MAG: hypothetical protein EBU88_19765, partial [Acidobacteria bacterium]|nr:hypothetical protein [Acidobacteriota bacterium]